MSVSSTIEGGGVKSEKERLKELEDEEGSVVAELLEKRHACKLLNEEINRLAYRQGVLKNSIAKIKNAIKPLYISDHAVVRYFQRVLGYDITKVREAILPPSVEDYAKTKRTGYVSVGDTHDAVIRDGTIVTIYKQTERNEKGGWDQEA